MSITITIMRTDGRQATATLFFSFAAHENIRETGCDVVGIATDLTSLVHGTTTAEKLLALCLDGSDPDREAGWRDYVSELARVASTISR